MKPRNVPEFFVATGLRKERVEALHDGIYAVAMTLLVLDFRCRAYVAE